MEKETLSVLEPQEEVVWQGVINRKVLVFGMVIFWFIIFIISRMVPNFGSLILIIGFLISIFYFFSSYVVRYFITQKRVLIKSGIIGTDFNSIYFTEVKSANVNVGLIGKIFGVGTINIDTGKLETVTSGSGNNIHTSTQTKYDQLVNINNPYEVYKHFQTSLTGRQESLYSGRADAENIEKQQSNLK